MPGFPYPPLNQSRQKARKIADSLDIKSFLNNRPQSKQELDSRKKKEKKGKKKIQSKYTKMQC